MSNYLLIAGMVIIIFISVKNLVKPSKKNFFGKELSGGDQKISKYLALSTLLIVVALAFTLVFR